MNSNQNHRSFDPKEYQQELITILRSLEDFEQDKLKPDDLNSLQKLAPKDGKGLFTKSELIAGYREFAGKHGLKPFDQALLNKLRMKPVRTISGVTPVTILTKPFPCPGKCIFCPNDVRMPKSYLADEPGAQRAANNHFDPYLQTYSRLDAYQKIGHRINKAEVIVLGGTWSFYPEEYKIWFIKRTFEALNDFSEGIDKRGEITPSITTDHVKSQDQGLKRTDQGLEVTYNQAIADLYTDQEIKKKKEHRETATWEELEKEQRRNETSKVRCVGLVLETRPDYISEEEVATLRRLGATKTQIGLQSLQDTVLEKNKRGHDVEASRRAMKLLRRAGFKIHAHWMANLYGSSVEKDIADYRKLFEDPDFKPDELKIYPCSLINDTELMNVYEAGEWHPYSQSELLEVVSKALVLTPEYCRLTRVIRDIPSPDIVTGNKKTNFRQIATENTKKKGQTIKDIRSREVRKQAIPAEKFKIDESVYDTSTSTEHFLQFITPERKLAGFLRLSLPKKESFIKELEGNAIIREVHVYGQVVEFSKEDKKAPQHRGFGKRLIKRAEEVAREQGFKKISVISAIGTKEYYRKRGFSDGKLYQHKDLN